jgi:hypothetical protein
VYLLVSHAYVNEMHGSGSKTPVKNLVHIYIYVWVCVCIYDVKFLVLLGAPYIYDISRLRVNNPTLKMRTKFIRLYVVIIDNFAILKICYQLEYYRDFTKANFILEMSLLYVTK